MATFQITGPDGKKYRVTGETPEGAMNAVRKAQQVPSETGESWAPENQEFGTLSRGDDSFLASVGNRLYDAANAIGLPASRMRRDAEGADAFVRGAADVATFGTSDEISAFAGSKTGIGGQQGNYEGNLELQRAIDEQDTITNPGARMGGQIAGGVGAGIVAGPYTLSSRFAGSALLPRALAGMGDGAIFGGAYGAGSGTDAGSRTYGAARDATIGAAMGGALPVAAAGAGRGYEGIRNALLGNRTAQQVGSTPEALRTLGHVLDADASLGPQGQANMARAGQEAMLVDAGPTARRVLDTSIQRSGPGSRTAREAVQGRVGRDAHALTQALDTTLGAPQGVTATRTAIRTGSAAARGNAYDDAYRSPIDYADPRGRQIEQLVRGRVPPSAIQRANQLMRTEGHESQQILARIGDDGSVTFERLPDVRQLDYITRALNDVAEAGEGAGAMGGQNALGRAYQSLSREIRDTLRGLVPEYGRALDTAADPIRRSQAVELGSRLLSPSMTRDQAAEAIRGMTQAERQALAQGVRSQIDDAMARVSRTVQDGDVPAREAIKALRDLSSRANREKLAVAIGEEPATRLFAELDRVAQSFDLRASVADNSATYARQALDQRVKDVTAPGVVGTAARGEPINATKRIIRALTGQTDEAVRGREDALYSELARLLTQRGGASQDVYGAINQLGQTDHAMALMRDRIVRALGGPHLAYPSSVLAGDRLPAAGQR